MLTAPNKSEKKALFSHRQQNHQQATGAIDDLKDHVYGFGSSQQSTQYAKTTAAIADYCGREHGKAMSLLVKGTECPPKESTRPSKSKKEANEWDTMKYEKQLNHWMKKKEKDDEN